MKTEKIILVIAISLLSTLSTQAQFHFDNDQGGGFYLPLYPYDKPFPAHPYPWWAQYYYSDYTPQVRPAVINLKNITHPVVPDYDSYANLYPWGTMLDKLPLGSIIATPSSSKAKRAVPNKYFYRGGQFFMQFDNGYLTVPSPVGYIIPSLPDGADKVPLGGTDYSYFAGTFFQPVPGGYVVVQAPVGAIVTNLPPWAQQLGEEGQINGYKLGTVIFQPVFYHGAKAFMVVQN